MPRLSALIEDFATRFNFEPTKVASLARALREAGQLTQGARGINAPPATSLDAARLLIAMMLNCRIATVVEDVALVGGFVPLSDAKFSDVFAPPTLEAAISGVIDYFGVKAASAEEPGQYEGFPASVRLVPHQALAYVSIARWDDKAEDWDWRRVAFSHPTLGGLDIAALRHLPEEYITALRRFPAGFNQEPELDGRTLFAIGQILAGHQLLHWQHP